MTGMTEGVIHKGFPTKYEYVFQIFFKYLLYYNHISLQKNILTLCNV